MIIPMMAQSYDTFMTHEMTMSLQWFIFMNNLEIANDGLGIKRYGFTDIADNDISVMKFVGATTYR